MEKEIKKSVEFNLSFSEYFGGKIIISEDGEYDGTDWISGRFYSGIFGGTKIDTTGAWFKVDKDYIRVDFKTKIKLEKK